MDEKKRNPVTVCLDLELYQEMKAEAQRHGRSLSYMVQLAWGISKPRLRQFKSSRDLLQELKNVDGQAQAVDDSSHL